MPGQTGLSARPWVAEMVASIEGVKLTDPRVTRWGSLDTPPPMCEHPSAGCQAVVAGGIARAMEQVSHRLRQWDTEIVAGGAVPQRQGRYASLREALTRPLDAAVRGVHA